MNMRVVQQVLSPGVQHTKEANLRAQMLRIGGDGANVSDAARNRISQTTVWFWNAMVAIRSGTVNTI